MNNETKILCKIWGAAFIYTCLISFFVQLILLPYLLPSYHAGSGLFIGTPDCIYFNRLAIDLAVKIKILGWGAWELRPEGQAPAGIAAFIYALTWSKPWVLIPINAVLHASAFLVLSRLLYLIINDRTKSILCSLPFLIFSSNLQWTAQLHKDGFSILGLLLVLQGIVSLSRLENYTVKHWFMIGLQSIFYCSGGLILTWIVRPVILTIIQPVLALCFLFLIILFVLRSLNNIVPWKRTLIASSLLVLLFFILSRQKTFSFRELDSAPENHELQNVPEFRIISQFMPDNPLLLKEVSTPEIQNKPDPLIVSQPVTKEPVLIKEAPKPEIQEKLDSLIAAESMLKIPILSKEVSAPKIQNKPEPLIVSQPVTKELVLIKEMPKPEIQNKPEPLIISQPVIKEPLLTKEKLNLEKQKTKINRIPIVRIFETECHWKRSAWLPVFIERKFYSLAEARWGFRNSAPEAGSNIDRYIGFNSVKDTLIYLPRATQIVLLAPFPKQWFQEGRASVNSFMRKAAAFEMTVIYFALIFLPYALWYWRKRIEIWIMFVFCMYMLVIYGLVVCNVGTLYRMRYVYITTLVALGIAGFIIFVEKNTRKNKRI